ncbi:MAG: aspartate aminotransferase family protein [Proteobacteria bacterium]|nr:aspartate aminotransferase family protein [Pseudomonadota bacterium]
MKKQTSHVIWYPGYDLLIEDIARAENCYLYDSQDKRYVDLESGVWCMSIGHGNSRIHRAIKEQSARISHAGFVYSNKIVEQAAEDILSLLGFEDGKCVFLSSGSEAVEYGVRVAQSIAYRPLLITMIDSYCGAYGSASRKSEDEWFCLDWAECAICPYSKECNDQCELWATIPFNRIGGFLLEPGSSSGLVRFPPKKLIRNIDRVVKQKNGLVIVNEVTTGVGRTGAWFGYQHYGISPDIVAIGKGIGNGYPVSVTAFAPGVIERLGDKPIKYAQSHQNDPLGAAVVREVIRTIREEELIARGEKIAAMLMAGLEAIKTQTDRIKEIRARGLMIAIEFNEDSETSFAIQTHKELVRRGFILGLRPGMSVFRIDPSLTIDREDIANFLETLDDILLGGDKRGRDGGYIQSR